MRFWMFIYGKDHMVKSLVMTDDYDEDEIRKNVHLKHLRVDVKIHKKDLKIKDTVYAKVVNEKGEQVGMIVA